MQYRFNQETRYIGSVSTNKERIAAIDTIISSLLLAQTSEALNNGLKEYWFDSGLGNQKVVQLTPAEISKAIFEYEKLKQYYINQINGRVFRFRSGIWTGKAGY